MQDFSNDRLCGQSLQLPPPRRETAHVSSPYFGCNCNAQTQQYDTTAHYCLWHCRNSDGLPPIACTVPLCHTDLLALGCMRAPRPCSVLAAALPAALTARRTSDTKTRDFVSQEFQATFDANHAQKPVMPSRLEKQAKRQGMKFSAPPGL